MKKKKYIVLVLMILLLLCLAIVFLVNGRVSQTEVEEEPEIIIPEIIRRPNIEVVRNRTAFYTVENSVNRFFRYLYDENEERLEAIVDSIFEEISQEGLQSFNYQQSFRAKAMEYKIIDNVGLFFVRGIITDMSNVGHVDDIWCRMYGRM